MAKLIYSMLTSLDGYIEDQTGDFSWAMPGEEVHAYVNQLGASVGIYLYGRRMYDVMVYWETAHLEPDQPQVALDWARDWQAADKIIYSQTLTEVRSANTKIEREFKPDTVKQLKAKTSRDLAVAGPELAQLALKAGLVDELQLVIFPVVVGGGKRFLPDELNLKLELLESRAFDAGVVVLRYQVKS